MTSINRLGFNILVFYAVIVALIIMFSAGSYHTIYATNKVYKPKHSMKAITKPACERLTTDMDIATCYGDVDSADPVTEEEDNNQYHYEIEDKE